MNLMNYVSRFLISICIMSLSMPRAYGMLGDLAADSARVAESSVGEATTKEVENSLSRLTDAAESKGGIIDEGMVKEAFGPSFKALAGDTEALSEIQKTVSSINSSIGKGTDQAKITNVIPKAAADNPVIKRVAAGNPSMAKDLGLSSVKGSAQRFSGPIELTDLEPDLASKEDLDQLNGLKEQENKLKTKGKGRTPTEETELENVQKQISKIESKSDLQINKLKDLKYQENLLEKKGIGRSAEQTKQLTEIRSEISTIENTDVIKTWDQKYGDNFEKTLNSGKPLEWTQSAFHAILSGLLMGVIFSVPQMLQTYITGMLKAKNFQNALIALGNFGNVNMQIPPSFVNSSHPELSPFLYFQVNPSSKSGNTYAYQRGGHAYVSIDQNYNMALSYLADPQFPGAMIDLATGYQFTQDGLAHERPVVPLLGSYQVAYGANTVTGFLNTFLSKLNQSKLPMYAEGLEAPSAISAPSGVKDYWNDLMNVIAASCAQLKTTVKFGTMSIQPFVARSQPYVAGKGYLTDQNLPANGVYIYQSDSTPLVKYAKVAGNTELVDYVVAMDSFGNIIPAHTITSAQSGAFMPNSNIAALYSLLNNVMYKVDGSMYNPQTPLSFGEYGSQLQKWADPSGKYKYLQAQTQYMQQVAIGGPFTPLQLALYYKDSASISNLLSASPQIIPVYTSTTTLGTDGNGNQVLDYFIAVGISNNQFIPVNLFNTQPAYLISLVTSRIYTPQGSLATTSVSPTDQVAAQLVPSIQAAVSAQAQSGTALNTVAIGQKYVPGALNPYGLPFPSNYFTVIYGLDQLATKDANGKTLNDNITASRNAWGSPYISQIHQYQSLTTQLSAELAKSQPNQSTVTSLQGQLATINKNIAQTESALGQKLGMCQFTNGLLFDIYFKIPTPDWIHNGNYFYQSVPGTAGAPVFSPNQYFVMSDSSNPSNLTDNIGMLCDPSSLLYVISISSGYVYDTNGNQVTDSSGKAIIFDVNQLLTRVQQNQIKAGGFAFMQNGQGTNNIGKALLASAQSWNSQQQQAYGPFSFYQFTLSIPSDFISAFKSGQYVYYATCSGVPAYQDYLICVEQTSDGKQSFGVQYSNATTQVISLVTGMAYNRAGLVAQYDQNQLYQMISAQYQGISTQVKTKIQAQEANFAQLTTPPPAPASPSPTFSGGMIQQLQAQQPVFNHPNLYQDPASGNYYQVDNVNNTIFDFNAPAAAIALLYPQEVASGQYKNRVGNVGIMYDNQGNYLMSISDWALQNMRAQAGVYVNQQGQEQLMPSNIIPLPLSPKDQNLKPGVSGTGLIVSTDPKFPTPNIGSMQDPNNPGTTYYFYYLSQGVINGKQTAMSSYLVRQVNATTQTDRYIDMNTGYTFKPDGSLASAQNEIAQDSLGQTIQIFRQSGDIAAVSLGGVMFTVWDSQQQSDGSTIYSLNDTNYNNLQIQAAVSGSNNTYNATLDVPTAVVNFDKSNNPTQLIISNGTYTLVSAGTNQWKDTTGTLQMSVDSSVTDQIVYLVQFLKTPSATAGVSSTAGAGTSTINYAVKAVDTYTGSRAAVITNTLTGATGSIVLDQSGKPQTIQYNGSSYTLKQGGTSQNQYIMYNAGQNVQITVVVLPTGVNIYTSDAPTTANEYAYDAELIASTDMTNLLNNVWQLKPTIDVYGTNYLVGSVNQSLLKQVQYSDIVVDDSNKDLYAQAITAGVFLLPTIFYDGVNQRYLYQFTSADAGMPYYNTDYTNWYVELTHGFAFDPTGAASGISFPITTLSQLLNKWNIGVATVSGQPKVKFTPGGGLLSTVSAKSTK